MDRVLSFRVSLFLSSGRCRREVEVFGGQGTRTRGGRPVVAWIGSERSDSYVVGRSRVHCMDAGNQGQDWAGVVRDAIIFSRSGLSFRHETLLVYL